MKLLIVDDEPKLVELLSGHFTHRGHAVRGTGSGEEALGLIQGDPPELILLDLSLKGKLTGKDILAQAKRLAPQARVIIVTGLVEAQPEEFLALGASGVLKKPIQLEELDQLVQQVSGEKPPSA